MGTTLKVLLLQIGKLAGLLTENKPTNKSDSKKWEQQGWNQSLPTSKVLNKWRYLQLGELLFDSFFFHLSSSDNADGIWTVVSAQMQNSSISTDDPSSRGSTHCLSAMRKQLFMAYTDSTQHYLHISDVSVVVVSLNDGRPLHVCTVFL